jgi:hypothetical protein
MRIVPLKLVQVRAPGQAKTDTPITFSYAETILGILSSGAVERGMSLAEISSSLRIVTPVQDAIDNDRSEIRLEDADHERLAKAVQAYRGYRLISPAVETFVKDIVGAPEVPKE